MATQALTNITVPTYTESFGTSLSGVNNTSHVVSVTSGTVLVYFLTGFFDSTGIGSITVDGGASINPTVSVASSATGGSNQCFAAVWYVTGLSGSHTIAWAGAAASMESIGTLAGANGSPVGLSNSTTSTGSTLSTTGTVSANSVVFNAVVDRTLTSGAPSTSDAGATTIRNNTNTPGPSLFWFEPGSGSATETANVQSSKPGAMVSLAVPGTVGFSAVSTVTGSLSIVRTVTLAGTSAGHGSVANVLMTRTRQTAGTATGSGTVANVLMTRTRQATGTAAGSTTIANVLMTRTRRSAGTPAGTATVSGSLGGLLTRITGTSAGATAISNTLLKRTRTLSTVVTGTGTSTAALRASRGLTAIAVGRAVVTANLAEQESLRGTVVGVATVTGSLSLSATVLYGDLLLQFIPAAPTYGQLWPRAYPV